MERLMGKIKWFSSRLHGGALTNIGGESLEFTSTDSVDGAPFTDGQVVTYQPSEDVTKPYADDVRAQPE